MICKCGPHTNVWRTTASCSVERFKASAYEEEIYHQRYACKKCCEDRMALHRRRDERDRAYNRDRIARERRERRQMREERRQRERERDRKWGPGY